MTNSRRTSRGPM